jgi:hypothetical protein
MQGARMKGNWFTRRKSESLPQPGEYSRELAWQRLKKWITGKWLWLLLFVPVPLVASLPLALVEHGVTRGILIGAALASGIWFVVGIVVVLSGVINPAMGAMGESWTADDLRALRRRGWKVVHGIRFPKHGDIDHVAVGPPGLLVVETKWSSNQWPMDGSSGFMSNTMNKAILQARENRDHVHGVFSRSRDGAPTLAAVVLQSAEARPPGSPPWFEADGVIVVDGPHLREWLRTLEDLVLDPEGVQRVATALREQRRQQVVERRAVGAGEQLTLFQLMTKWLIVPTGGFLIMTSVLLAVNTARSWELDAICLLLLMFVSFFGQKFSHLRSFFIGMLVGSIFILATFLEVVVKSRLGH